MKVIITSYGADCSDKVDPRFGRAAYFMVYDDQENTWESVCNQQNLEAAKGAGIQAAENVRKLEGDILITGNVGPKAFKVLNANGIKVLSASEFAVREAYEAFKEGKLVELTNANVEGHWF